MKTDLKRDGDGGGDEQWRMEEMVSNEIVDYHPLMLTWMGEMQKIICYNFSQCWLQNEF